MRGTLNVHDGPLKYKEPPEYNREDGCNSHNHAWVAATYKCDNCGHPFCADCAKRCDYICDVCPKPELVKI